MFEARSVFMTAYSFTTLLCGLSGCLSEDIGEGLDDTLASPAIDGPFEVEVRTRAGVDAGLARAGVFNTRDANGNSIDVLVSRGGKAKLEAQDEGAQEVLFTPLRLLQAGADGKFIVELPEQPAADASYRVVVWVDADGDGKLRLGTSDGTSEFARAPSRPLDASARTMSLYSVQASAPGVTKEGSTGSYTATAMVGQQREDGFTEYSSVKLADEQLIEWTVELAAPSM